MGVGQHVYSAGSWSHTVDLEVSSRINILVDSRKVKVTLSEDRKWVRVGCTRVSVAALQRLNQMLEHAPSKEIVLQEE